MLEKIGLPPKPSVRGNNWVVDASHCQGCSSQFTFINRKHHCRRCGGLFCGSCTQGRMVLRGQGDSPVRICEPCKNLEEAARFEMRYGHKNRAGKGGSKPANKDEDDVLHQILGGEHKQSLSSKSASSSGDMLVNAEVATRSASSSSFNDTVPDVTPEELRQQALEEKKKHRTLKSEGKPEEALKAFKRGKELERQAAALEIHLRKIRKMTASSSHISEPKTKTKDKDDIASELKDLGWSDMDLQESAKKPVKLSVESELYSLIGEVSDKPLTTRKKAGGVDRSQVLAHKKKALELKREGNLAEAKEELKKAKVLEKKIEEQELLGDDDDEESDDELAALIRSMDEDKDDDMSLNFDVNPLVSIPDDINLDNLDVTEDDLEDPDLAAEMLSLGWQEDVSIRKSDDSVRNSEALLSEIQSLKKEALSHKRAGNNTEALTLFKKAKMLEKDLNNTTSSFQEPELMDHEPEPEPELSRKPAASKSRFVIQRELLDLKKKALALRREGKSDESDEMLKKGKILEQQLQEMENTSRITQTGSGSSREVITDVVVEDDEEEGEVNDQDLNDPTYLSLLKNLGWEDDHSAPPPLPQEKNVVTTDSVTRAASINAPLPKKSKGEVQRELLGLKRKYRALRQEGQTEEAEETLKMANVLETQLADFDTPTPSVIDVSTVLPPVNEVPNINDKSSGRNAPQNEVTNSLEDDIMAHKRRALALKREGNIAEAKEELKLAKMLEKQMQENNTSTLSAKNESSPNAAQKSPSNQNASTLSAKNESTPNTAQKSLPNDPGKQDSSPDSGPKPLSSRDRFKLQREALNHKREALKLRREGKTQEAEAETELAKAIEAQIEESDKHDPKRASAEEPVDNDAMVDDFLDPQLLSALKAIGINKNNTTTSSSSSSKPRNNSEAKITEKSNNERMQFEEQIKAEKLKAFNFKKAGKQAEALDALRRAKALEKKMNSLAA